MGPIQRCKAYHNDKYANSKDRYVAGFQVFTIAGVKDVVCLLSCQEIDESTIIA